MGHLLQSLIMSLAVIGIASPSFADGDREDRGWDREKKEQSRLSKKDKQHGNPFDKILEQLDDLNDKLDELLANGVDLRGVTQNWDKKLDSTNGDANGCNSDRFTCIWPTDEYPDGAAVRDNETGLVWVRDPDGGGNWYQGLAYCTTLEVAGRKGWHMPLIEQFTSLFVDGGGLPSGNPFLATGTNYWSATTADEPAVVWAVVPATGFVFTSTGKLDDDSAFVWCVRGGQSFDGQDVNGLN